MTVGSLFAGIGGFELAAQWAGLTPVWSNEIDPFCCQVLRKNFKHRIIEDDIRNIGKHNLEPVDILTGGFPCQPYSTAGKRLGKEDARHLWPQMLRVIGEIQPKIVVGENVYGLLNWSGGLVFDEVQTDLENIGYEVTPFVLPACGVEAPHRRDRIWFIAHSYSHGDATELVIGENSTDQRSDKRTTKQNNGEGKNEKRIWSDLDGSNTETLSNPNNIGCKGRIKGIESPQKPRYDSEGSSAAELRHGWQRDDLPAPTLSRMDDGVSGRVDRLKSLGNAIVPQVALEIFKAIKESKIS